MASSGIEQATFRFVIQHLNHLLINIKLQIVKTSNRNYYQEMLLVLISDRGSGRRANEMKRKNYTTSEDVYHFHLTSNFISMIELHGDEKSGKYM